MNGKSETLLEDTRAKNCVHPGSSFDTSGRTVLPIMVSGLTQLTALSISKGVLNHDGMMLADY
jgi:hypothetical protein